MKTTNPKNIKEDGAGGKGSCGNDDGGRRRDQVGDVDDHLRRGWRRVREERKEDGGNESESNSISRSSLISGSNSVRSSSDSPSKSSPPHFLVTRR